MTLLRFVLCRLARCLKGIFQIPEISRQTAEKLYIPFKTPIIVRFNSCKLASFRRAASSSTECNGPEAREREAKSGWPKRQCGDGSGSHPFKFIQTVADADGYFSSFFVANDF